MTYLVLAYSIVWILILVYTWIVHEHQTKLDRQITILEEMHRD
ncbi:MAG: CcmD family protein [Firmicutes bacterium]|jgi:CcmD family protein|nr:CcmD family protein [Bacillota bacterium]NLL88992.1 CcmD family protein [Bacillota bacterium]HKM16649.1 CcmD family protein [Limnochordia bacterium]